MLKSLTLRAAIPLKRISSFSKESSQSSSAIHLNIALAFLIIGTTVYQIV